MKTYVTKEECLKVNGEHAWYAVEDDTPYTVSCAMYHPDGHCDWNDPKQKCHHCPATRRFRRIQAPQFEWREE